VARLGSKARALLITVLMAAAVGGGWAIGASSDMDEMESHDTGAPASAAEDDRDVERGFLQAMVPHHESGIEMAQMALEHSQAPVIRRLSQAIVDTQAREIEQMRKMHERLFGEPLEPDGDAHMALGLSAEEAGMAGMSHGGEMMRKLADAKPFDRAYVDDMVPHHQGAVAMAEVLLERTDDAELKRLAQAIIDAQRREIATMNDFRTKEYGGPVPEKPGDGGHGGMKME
jgi:uncharacterized protein (DUF305 family)